MRIDQWTPDLRRGDAIGDSILRLRDRFRAWGHRSEVFSLTFSADVAGEARAFADWTPTGPEDVVILHSALASPLTAALAEQPGRRVLIHHNVTPPEFYADWDPELARICREGRAQAASLRDHVDLALGDSEFNRHELEQMGFARTGVLRIYLDFERYLAPVLKTLQLLKEMGMWFEIVVRVIPTLNDNPAEIKEMVRWIQKNLGPDVPIHFTRFHPMYKIKNLPPTAVSTLETCDKIAKEAGLHYVYIGNVPGHPAENTYCPRCNKMLIQRMGYAIIKNEINGGKCSCGQAIAGVWKNI